MSDEEATEAFTPSEEQQTLLILQGKCPHNKGWTYDGHTSHEDAYKCRLCGFIKWY